MLRSIQYIISETIKLVLPFIFLAFFIAGGTAIYISGVIEYHMLEALFPKSVVGILVLVLTLECAKAALIFIDGLKKDNVEYLKIRTYFSLLRYALITVSVLSTMIYSLYNLSNPTEGQVNSNEIAEARIAINEQKEEVNEIIEAELVRYSAKSDSDIFEINALIEIEKQNTFRSTNLFDGPRFKELKGEKIRLEEKHKIDFQDINDRRILKLESLDKDLETRIEHIKEKNKDFLKTGSPIILAALKVANLATDEPNELQYIVFTVLMSLLLTICIELTIFAVFSIASIQYATGFNLILDGQALHDTHNTVHETIKNAHSSQKKTNHWANSTMLKDFIDKAKSFAQDQIDKIGKSINK